MTDLSRFVWIDRQLCLSMSSQGRLQAFPAGPLLHYTGYHIKAFDTLKTRLCQQVPPLYQLYPCYTHTRKDCIYIHTNVLDRIKRIIIEIRKWKRFGEKDTFLFHQLLRF